MKSIKLLGLVLAEFLEFCQEVLSDKPLWTFWAFVALAVGRLGYLGYRAGTVFLPVSQFFLSLMYAALAMVVICLLFVILMMIPWPVAPEERRDE